MFKLITNKSNASEEASAFAFDNIDNLSSDSTALNKMIPSYTKFPCLIDWFINFDWKNRQMLDYNLFHRSEAKCLVYPSTNKSKQIYRLMLKSEVDIEKRIRRLELPTPWKKTVIMLDSGFNEVMAARGSSNELFFVKVRMVRRGNDDPNYLRVSAINLTMAKELVYYTKNNKPKFFAFDEPGLNVQANEVIITTETIQNTVDASPVEDVESLIEVINTDQSRVVQLINSKRNDE